MNIHLTNQIIRHILSCLRVIKSDFVGVNYQSLMQNNYLIPNKLKMKLEDDLIIENNIWACKFSIEDKRLIILLADVTIDDIKEYSAIIHLQNSPTYGIYLNTDDISQSLIACSINGKEWMKCSVYLEATFLAAMEQMKNFFLIPEICDLYKEEYDSLISFMNFHDVLFEEKYEGEKD